MPERTAHGKSYQEPPRITRRAQFPPPFSPQVEPSLVHLPGSILHGLFGLALDDTPNAAHFPAVPSLLRAIGGHGQLFTTAPFVKLLQSELDERQRPRLGAPPSPASGSRPATHAGRSSIVERLDGKPVPAYGVFSNGGHDNRSSYWSYGEA